MSMGGRGVGESGGERRERNSERRAESGKAGAEKATHEIEDQIIFTCIRNIGSNV